LSQKTEPTEYSLFSKFCAMMKTVFSALFITLFLQFACGQNRNDQDWAVLKYIDKYKRIAVDEMRRAGVPASIKMAQAILESNAGRSVLAKKANNHFGMKCGSYWKGETYYRKDDDLDINGKLIPSCFRKYEKGRQSFFAHTEFLQKRRYRFLFSDLQVTDYESWAHGLKSAGYATNPEYAYGLIRIIKRYELYKLDKMALNVKDDEQPTVEDRSDAVTGGTISRNNQLRVVYASNDMTANDIASKYRKKLKCLLKYNEEINDGGTKLKDGDAVYLQRKRRNWRGRERYHEVEAGETMYSISQKYGVRLSKLYKKNRIPKGMDPQVGEKVKIRGGKIKAELVPRYGKRVAGEDNVEVDNNTNTTTGENDEEFLFEDDIVEVYHLVKKGDTLYNIALRYDITVRTLKRWNKLDTDTISIGQRLRVK